MDELNFDLIDESSAAWLEHEFEAEKNINVVRRIAMDKATSLDGSTMAFFSNCWETACEDLMKVFSRNSFFL